MYAYRNRAQLQVTRERLVEVMEDIARDFKLIIDTGTTCCGTCGRRALLESMNPEHTGYFFWHVQKDDDFEHGGVLGLHYGHRYGNRPRNTGLAARICAALKKHGVTHNWSGRELECIMVPIAPDPGFQARREAEWRQMMIDN